jgi:hypothetical protein
MLFESVLLDKISFAEAALKLGFMYVGLQMLTKAMLVDEKAITLSAVRMSCSFLMIFQFVIVDKVFAAYPTKESVGDAVLN